MKQLAFAAFIIASMVLFSCRSAKKIQSAIAKKDTITTVVIDDSHADSIKYIRSLLSRIDSNRINFNTFSAKVKVEFEDKDGKQPDLTVFIRIQKDSLIWLSINATILSYEALRILITPDSVKVLNKKDKIYQLRSVNYLQDLTQLPFDFKTIQDLLVGNPIYLDSNVVSYKKNENNILLMNVNEFFKNLVTVGSSDFLMQHSKLDDTDLIRNRTCDLTYSNYENKNSIKFPTKRRITVSEKSKLDVDMEFKQYSFNEILSYPFSIPKNYKQQ
jgi:hypothetical protein